MMMKVPLTSLVVSPLVKYVAPPFCLLCLLFGTVSVLMWYAMILCGAPAGTVVATDCIASHILSAIPLLGR